jgi:predicted nucleic acid-binding protein
VVIDASVWVSRLVTADVHYGETRRWLDQYVGGGSRLVAPVLLLLEVAGAVARRTGQTALAQQAVQYLESFAPLQIVILDTQLGSHAARLAADLHLRGADAACVALAHQLGIPLVTWDAEQQTRSASMVVTHTPASAPI